ncbi:Lcl domain-containing protein [Vibrio parahaemolyticus]
MQENCSDATVSDDGLVFEVEAPSGQWCDYQYTVASEQADAPSSSATMSVFSTSATQATLPPLSHPMLLSDTNATFDLQALLGSDWPSGYALSTQPVIVQGSEGNLGSATSTGNTITYTPPANAGWNRLIYTLTDAGNPGNDVVGALYVTVSDTLNHPPLISNPKYDYNAENGNQVVTIGTPIDIDLSGLISEPDGQEWQVIKVQSYTEMAYPKDANSITNKVITYVPSVVGEHIISYIVADHYGGYSSGLIKVTNSENEQASSWTSLAAGGATYSAPLRYSEGVNSGFAVSAIWDVDVNNTLSGYSGVAGNAYCHSVGALPTQAHMQQLRSTHYQAGGGGPLNAWPARRTYLIQGAGGSGYQGYDIATGTTSAYSPQTAYYVTCVVNENIQLTMLMREVVADGQVNTIARIDKPALTTVQLDKIATSQPDDLQAGNVDLNLAGTGNQQEVTTASIKAGTYRFSVANAADSSEVLSSPIITYIGDVTNPVLTKKAGSTDSATADDAAEVSATFELKDVNNNPLANQSVNFAWTASALDGVTVTSPATQVLSGGTGTVTGTTDAAGEVLVKAKSSTAMSDITVTASIIGASLKTWSPTFCTNLAGACLDILNTGSGKLFTSSPSKAYLDSIGGSATNSTFSEDGTWGPVGDFYLFDWSNANALCTTYKAKGIGGRTNWRLATRDELKVELYDTYGNMFTVRGWPTRNSYWSATPAGSYYYYVYLHLGNVYSGNPSLTFYASCVSDP